MRRRGTFSDLVHLLRQMAEYFCAQFDHMPPVRFALGDRVLFEREQIQARYTRAPVRLVEFSPGLVELCWLEKNRCWNTEKVKKVLLHELTHAWVDATGRWSDDAGGHNAAFLWKAHQVGLALPTTRHRWPAVVPLHEEIKRGWNPNFMSLGEWREFAKALENWDSKDWQTLLSDCGVVERIEKRVPAGAWPGVVKDVGRWNPFVSDYELVKNIKTYVPADLLYWVGGALGVWHIPAYELVEDLRGRTPHSLMDCVGKWRDAIWAVEQWERAPAGTILNELESLHADEQDEIARVISRCEPLRKVLARVKEQFYQEIDEINRNADHLGIGCSEDGDDSHLYAEANYSFFPKLTTNTTIFEDFCKLCAV